MPISSPLPDRKIGDESLAFTRDQSLSGGVAITTQQQNDVIRETTTVIKVDETALAIAREQLAGDITTAIVEAERRANLFYRAWDWDIKSDQQITSTAWNIIGYDNEVVRSDGAYGTASGWAYICPQDASGIYSVYASARYKALVAQAVLSARLAIFKNGTMYRIIDIQDSDMAGELPMEDVVLQGATSISLNGGDNLTVRVQLNGGVWGPSSFIYPTSVVGYCYGHRIRCNSDIIEIPDPQSGFILG